MSPFHQHKRPTGTFGPAFNAALDGARIHEQMARIREFMLAVEWKTLSEISAATGDPPASVSAQLRHLRKARFGAYTVNKRRRGTPGKGLWEYHVRATAPPEKA